MEKGRLFGAAVDKVKQDGRPGQRNCPLRSDIPRDSRTVTKLGGRTPGHRRLSLEEPQSETTVSYGKVKATPRKSQKSDPYKVSPRLIRRNSDDLKWKHDLYEGDVSGHSGSSVFLRNLPSSVTKQQLTKLFSRAGVIVSIKIDAGPLTTARVAFLKRNSAADAINEFHGYKLLGKQIKVSELSTLEDKSAAPDTTDDDIGYDPRTGRPTFFARNSNQFRGPTTRRVMMSEAPRRSVFERLA